MWNPATALIWEQWRRTRWALAAFVGVTVIVSWMVAAVSHALFSTPYWESDEVIVPLWFMGSMMLGLWILVCHSDVNQLGFTLPDRMRSYPLSETKMIGLVTSYKFVTFLASNIVVALLVGHQYEDVRLFGCPPSCHYNLSLLSISSQISSNACTRSSGVEAWMSAITRSQGPRSS